MLSSNLYSASSSVLRSAKVHRPQQLHHRLLTSSFTRKQRVPVPARFNTSSPSSSSRLTSSFFLPSLTITQLQSTPYTSLYTHHSKHHYQYSDSKSDDSSHSHSSSSSSQYYSSSSSSSSQSSSSSFFSRIWSSYMSVMNEYPLLLNILQSGILLGISDYCCQLAEYHLDTDATCSSSSSSLTKSGREPFEFNYKRTMMCMAFGGLAVGPLGFKWYMWLDKVTTYLCIIQDCFHSHHFSLFLLFHH